MLSLEDVGYGSKLSWTYTYRHSTAVSTFEKEYSLIGVHLIALLNAAKRLHVHARPATIQKAAMCVRVLSRAIAKFAPDSTSPAVWHKALVSELAEDDRAERSRWSICNHANAILKEVARIDGAFPRLVNPFDRTSASIPILDKDALSELRRYAREDAEKYRRAFLEPAVSPYREIIEEARLMAARNGGTFLRTGNRAFWAFMARVKRATAPIGCPWGSREVASRLYATSEAIMPFFILLVDKLAANVDATAEMKRDCMTEFDNPITGKRFLIDVPKPRSGDNVPPYSVADYGSFSVPGIIRFVLAYTEPLVPLAEPEDRGFLFLVDTRSRNIRPLSAIPASVAFKTYKQTRGIRGAMTLNMIRPTRLVSESNARWTHFECSGWHVKLACPPLRRT